MSTVNFHVVKSPAFLWFSGFLSLAHLGISEWMHEDSAQKENTPTSNHFYKMECDSYIFSVLAPLFFKIRSSPLYDFLSAGNHEIAHFRYRFPFSELTGIILGGNMYIVYYYCNFCQIKICI